MSKEYLLWVKSTGQKNLTNTQHEFAEFLLKNNKEISKIGNLNDIFLNIRKWIKNNPEVFKDDKAI